MNGFKFGVVAVLGAVVGLLPGYLFVFAVEAWRQPSGVSACPLPGDNLGTRQSATSASSEASLTGQGMGSMPMLTCVPPVPRVIVREIRHSFGGHEFAASAGVAGAAAGQARAARADAAGAQALPDGNHGDNKTVAEPTPGVTA